ncbi:MAG TPA: hypothetical protein DDX47_00480 [Candidatus Jacksonbacteria bacterium]|nr:MAG: hypothetical protein UW45_C0005G0025 [Parcubacteria group bacterium GW2011_GWC2_44_22]OGY76455.1 MAG: hypothetical protein A2295_02275 [Candidatus Jacksonbacteria bacterium RIFOXYB2_FULL_44_15]OGY76826.1 MAG: hypothetical protein A2240_04610 [Candidatus Jacksonbacteria bacterium RIFOXYA2_FULL_43_12]OGY82185.1 MAG: hypothetical protein A2550_05780 [Candidatus Jacksonbacteria bacterium RIFOXYD2_FULL_43_21]HBH45832.1 hypothetical protein [Candidatus Jacksonbacteria bacterium]
MNTPLYRNKKYQIKLDERYGYYHLFPIPTPTELETYYKKKFYSNHYSKQINDSSRQVQDADRKFLETQYGDIVETIKKESLGNKIIDIGCGYGNFLKFCMNRGFTVTGLDPAKEAVADIQKNVRNAGINVYVADIENIRATIKQKYHTAIMLNVLEHLRQPYKILQDIKKHILVKNGLLIVKVPNEFNKLQVIANQMYGLKKWWVCIPQHINYFTVEHLEKLITKCGYNVILKESTFPLEMFILFGDQYVGHPKLGKKIHQKRIRFEKILTTYDNAYKRKIFQTFAQIGLGREITIYARKK